MLEVCFWWGLDSFVVKTFLRCNFGPHFLGPFVHKELQFLYSTGRLLPYHFKVHFEYCCGACSDEDHDTRVTRFKSIWFGAADHYVNEWNKKWKKKYLKTVQPSSVQCFSFPTFLILILLVAISEILHAYKLDSSKRVIKEIKKNAAERIRLALTEFLEPILNDCEYFVYNQRTFGNESFHGLCNRYYEKGSSISFPLFIMKRQFAFLDWNEQMTKKSLGQEDCDLQDWQIKLLHLLRESLVG